MREREIGDQTCQTGGEKSDAHRRHRTETHQPKPRESARENQRGNLKPFRQPPQPVAAPEIQELHRVDFRAGHEAHLLRPARVRRGKLVFALPAELGEQLTKVLAHFQQISQIDTAGVEPLVTPSDIDFYTRPDVAHNPNTTEEILQNAPEKGGNLFKVPPVV